MTDKSSVNEHEFLDLLARLDDGRLDGMNMCRLEELIQHDERFRQQYLEHCQMISMMHAENGLMYAGVSADEPSTADEPTVRPRLLQITCPRLLVAAAVAVALVVLPWRLWFLEQVPSGHTPYRGEPVAKVTNVVGAKFASGISANESVEIGSEITQGTYHLLEGLLEIQYESGANLLFEAPAEFKLIDVNSTFVALGSLAAHIPPEAVGFVVETNSGRVIDLGTDFAIHASNSSDTEVHVFEGEVRVEPVGLQFSKEQSLTLYGGNATRINGGSGLPYGIDLDTQKFVRSTDSHPKPYTKRILENNPAVYYRMEPTDDGATLLDSSGGHYHAVVSKAGQRAGLWKSGKFGAAIQLNGAGDSPWIAASSYPQATGSELSVVAWVYANSRPMWASIVKNWGRTTRGQLHFGLQEFSGELEAHITDGQGEQVGVLDSQPFPLGAWQHVAMVADGQVLRLFRNGEQVGETPYDGLSRTASLRKLAIGTKLNDEETQPAVLDGGFLWDGRLDEIAVFNHAITSEQIRALFELGADE